MPFSLHYFTASKTDVRQAKLWYENQKTGLGKYFWESVKETLIEIQKNPLRYSIRYENIRVARTKTFPYSVHFCIQDSNKIVIIAIVHNKRHPDVSRKRI
jgi:mRNA-degrading endonuclease RelE of RelBE toxin-antitoxin system